MIKQRYVTRAAGLFYLRSKITLGSLLLVSSSGGGGGGSSSGGGDNSAQVLLCTLFCNAVHAQDQHRTS